MLGFNEKEKPENPVENLSKQSTALITQLACSVDSGRDHIDAMPVLSLLLLELRHPVFIEGKIPTLKWVTNP